MCKAKDLGNAAKIMSDCVYRTSRISSVRNRRNQDVSTRNDNGYRAKGTRVANTTKLVELQYIKIKKKTTAIALLKCTIVHYY